ncbi:hypothetical protein PFISCL1PPCAC_16712, partial [Pristionchus fissidentatus]
LSRPRLVDDDGQSTYGEESNDLDENDGACSEADGGQATVGEDWNSEVLSTLAGDGEVQVAAVPEVLLTEPVVLARRLHAEGDGTPRAQVLIRRGNKETFEDEETLTDSERQISAAHSMATEEQRKKVVLESLWRKDVEEYQDHKDTVYSHFTSPRGLCLIISNENYTDSKRKRRGTKKDMDGLSLLFYKLGYEVLTRQDLTRKVIGR